MQRGNLQNLLTIRQSLIIPANKLRLRLRQLPLRLLPLHSLSLSLEAAVTPNTLSQAGRSHCLVVTQVLSQLRHFFGLK